MRSAMRMAHPPRPVGRAGSDHRLIPPGVWSTHPTEGDTAHDSAIKILHDKQLTMMIYD